MDLVLRNLNEDLGSDKLEECIKQCGTFNVYWGTAPTGRPHIAYFLPMVKIADFLKAGCGVTVLFANLHAYLDNMKAPWELLQLRTEYYETLIKGMLKALQVPLEKLRFVRGTEYQLKENYTASVYKIIATTTAHDAAKAGCEVVKQTSDPFISGIVYPLLQALDEEFLNVDAQFGGVDQRKIFIYAEKYLTNLGFAKRAHLMNPMIPGLTGGKMSASEENSKIDLLNDRETVIRKLKSAVCIEPTAQTNGILAFIKCVFLPNKHLFNNDLLNKYNSIEEIENDFADKKLTEEDVKNLTESCLCLLMANLSNEFIESGKPNLEKEAYRDAAPEQEKVETNQFKSILNFPVELESLTTMFPSVSNIATSEFPVIEDKPTIIWSCRATGEPHIGYLIPIRQLAELSLKNWRVVILIEDIGAHLHSHHNLNKPAWNLIASRAALYKQFIRAVFEIFHGDSANMEIVLGSQFQLSKEYALRLYQSFSHMTERECNAMVCAMVNGQADIVSNLSSIIYPCMTALDQWFLKATVRLVGDYSHIDSLHIFSQKLNSQLHVSNRLPVFVKHCMIPALNGSSQMKCPKIGAKTAPKDTTSITLCDTKESIARKMKKAFFDPKSVDNDPTLLIIDRVVLPSLAGQPFLVKRTVENGGDVEFIQVEDIKQQLIGDLMHPGDVKQALAEHLDQLFIDPIKRKIGITSAELLVTCAFPPEAPLPKLNKKMYNPNKIDMRIATVSSIVYQAGSYSITLDIGLDRFVLIRNHCYGWTPNDQCLITLVPSRSDREARMIGVLCISSTTDQSTPVVPVRLVPQCNLPNQVYFKHQEPVCLHLREKDEQVISKEISSRCRINSGRLEWIGENKQAPLIAEGLLLIQNQSSITLDFN